MFGIKIIHFCCSGVISCGKPQWSLQEQWHTHTHTHTHTRSYRRVTSKTTDSDTLSFTRIPAVCGAQSEVLGAGPGPCRLFVPQSPQEPLKNSFAATDVFTSKENSNTQRKQTRDHTGLCTRLYRCPFVSVPWKKTSRLPVCDLCAFCGVMLRKRCRVIKDCWLLVNPSGWLG